jgi:hypothetical protein
MAKNTSDEQPFEEPFAQFFSRHARRALRSGRTPGGAAVKSGAIVNVSAKPADDRRSGELARFLAGVLIAPRPDEQLRAWQVEGVLCRDPNGPPLVCALEVRHFPLSKREPRSEVTGTILRGVPLGRIREMAFEGLAGTLEARRSMAASDLFPHVSAEDVDPAERATSETRKPRRGRRGLPDEHYRRIALRYLQLIELGRRNVLVALAEEESNRAGHPIPRETVRDWVRKATERGYLAPGKPGRAVARPGPKFKRKET